ncbi:methylated-DNA--[protein]-cysteine S-methyltransferase [Acidihalobacter aeolianus]|uniref:methylated-DNA--[protein]-cysteine S-methyltransferase n=1 Tax=Acidihalobacter aeolianus TaxID=2792603 RepID=UPI0009F4888F|nr:methylated-DNA--[protein]-cysteine S-methyltransferase [Acidihalobacter aeolianus]
MRRAAPTDVAPPSSPRATGRRSDYARIATAIEYICAHADEQPGLEAIARQVHLSPFHFQRLFTRWAGITPKRFLEALTLEHAKALLSKPVSLLEVSDAVGLSSGSRLHEHFVHLEAVTPGQFKSRGRDLRIGYGVHETPFGPVFVAMTEKGICDLTFVDPHAPDAGLDGLRARWSLADIAPDPARTAQPVAALFDPTAALDRPLSLHVTGTNFQTRVWHALLAIPPGRLTSYAGLAEAIGRPGAARAVGQAVGANPVALLIPCHRVIRESGGLGGYRWGLERKRALLAWETAARPAR